ncbi:MAG: ABC transporter permease [Oscillospiraceae bacterium]|nr:ABC transporter permease [Oscillospiraceae bacterium]
MWDIILLMAPYAVAYSCPLMITALGGLYSERSGVVNIGLEGLMVIGSFSAAFCINMFGISVWSGLLIAMLVSSAFSVLHAFASINLNANQIISGTAINMIAGAVTVFFARNITGSGNIRVDGLRRFNLPLGLSEVPVLGPFFFTNTYATTWLIFAMVAASIFIINKTSFGLRLRACGENPHAADAAGINVRRIRYAGVMISGALAGLGGATILVTYAGEFNGSVAGLGFLALASLIFGQWKPLGIVGATLFFGAATTISNVSQIIPQFAAIPEIVIRVFPYVITLLALVMFSKSSSAPRAAGQPFDQGKR